MLKSRTVTYCTREASSMSTTRMTVISLVFFLLGSEAKEIEWPASMPAPYALFRFDEGKGLQVENEVCVKSASTTTPGCGKDFFLKSNKGKIYVQDDHQPNYDKVSGKCGDKACHPGANWLRDDHFGNVLSCGNGDTLHKDAIRLPDLDYGSKDGKWAFNFWLKTFDVHSDKIFNPMSQEYILTHGAPNEPISSRDHIFIYLQNKAAEDDSWHGG